MGTFAFLNFSNAVSPSKQTCHQSHLTHMEQMGEHASVTALQPKDNSRFDGQLSYFNYIWLNQLSNTTNLWWIDV